MTTLKYTGYKHRISAAIEQSGHVNKRALPINTLASYLTY
jgi:hypothetical protein